MKNYKRIAVVGGGVFGCTSAFILAKSGYQVDLFEQKNDIFNATSSINQYRLHRGYHYPRSKETAQSSKEGEKTFLDFYGASVFNSSTESHYCIANEGSKVTEAEYLDFLDDVKLRYEKEELDFLVDANIALTVRVDEQLFDPNLLKLICKKYLETHKVNVHLNTTADIKMLSDYDYIVNATYSNLNSLLPSHLQKKYQFELCEKPILKLPEIYKNKSVVIMDGPFTCIDPLKGTPYHVMGNVEHAIHDSNIGLFPEPHEKFKDLLNNGIVKNLNVSNIEKFYATARTFFKNVEEFEYIGSMYTYRAVLPNRDLDDARPTLVSKVFGNVFSVFSGKIGTCVDAANELLYQINKDRLSRKIQ